MADESIYDLGYEAQAFEREEWWLATPEPLLIWARLRILHSGVAQVFDSHGETLSYESDDMARAALMDADFRALEGMDDDDAEAIGQLLEDLQPPQGEDDEELLPQMIKTLGPRH
ncbi:hypothetical protein [Arenimonas oryziterrae]|uniref:Uncharacterized protein n=1 Tax=Arenimonas oryziterrae DSM 21050 = YC6267 TaxID=1121015 RepID=A0A091BJV6_9GAMM|nr:hypothetical protein [Arenimonas oryziterrae]KFN44615.1 hypothetical protein N789_00995 [Arenimonas oryziterrae DSM 21050 = YC6267]